MAAWWRSAPCSYRYNVNLPLHVPVKAFWQSVNMWWSYEVMKLRPYRWLTFFGPPGIRNLYAYLPHNYYSSRATFLTQQRGLYYEISIRRSIEDRPIGDRPTTDRPTCHLGKFQTAMSPQWVIRSTSCLVLGWGFRGRRIEWRYFQFEQFNRCVEEKCARIN